MPFLKSIFFIDKLYLIVSDNFTQFPDNSESKVTNRNSLVCSEHDDDDGNDDDDDDRNTRSCTPGHNIIVS